VFEDALDGEGVPESGGFLAVDDLSGFLGGDAAIVEGGGDAADGAEAIVLGNHRKRLKIGHLIRAGSLAEAPLF